MKIYFWVDHEFFNTHYYTRSDRAWRDCHRAIHDENVCMPVESSDVIELLTMKDRLISQLQDRIGVLEDETTNTIEHLQYRIHYLESELEKSGVELP